MKESNSKGVMYVMGDVILWGMFPVLVFLSVKNINPFLVLGISNFFAFIFFLVLLALKKGSSDNFKLSTNCIKSFFFISIFYLLLYAGLMRTSPLNASALGLTEILFTIVNLYIVTGQKISKKQIMYSLIMIGGVLMILSPENFNLQSGDFLILLSAMFPSLADFYAKKSLRKNSVNTFMAFRSLFVFGACLLVYFISDNEMLQLNSLLKIDVIKFAAYGVLFFGISKILWLNGIKNTSIFTATSLRTLIPLFTIIFSFFVIGSIPNMYQFMGAIILIFSANRIIKH